jgi:hypothetical protein
MGGSSKSSGDRLGGRNTVIRLEITGEAGPMEESSHVLWLSHFVGDPHQICDAFWAQGI